MENLKLTKEERRETLINSAQRLFLEKGYHHTTTRDIAKEAGVTEPVIYKHFSSKHDLFFEVIYKLASSLLDDLKIEEEVDLEVFIEKFMYFHLETVDKHFESLKFLLTQMINEPKVKESYAKMFLPKMMEKVAPLIKNVSKINKESLEYNLFLLGGILMIFELSQGLFNKTPGGISRKELSKKLAHSYMGMVRGGRLDE